MVRAGDTRGFVEALFCQPGNDDPTVKIILTPEPIVVREPSPDYQRALTDVADVLREEVSMPDMVIAYLLDLARAREVSR